MPPAPLIEVTESAWEELRSRIRAARWPRPWPIDGWSAGTAPRELRRLAGYWADGFDWRAQEEAINALPSHLAHLDGASVHYLRFDGETPDAVPIVLTHGWPSTFLEEVELARRLSRPSEYGANGAPAFTAIVPSLPGFPFSPEQSRMPGIATHELWHALMTRLGFTRYLAHGGDLGAGISARLAQAHPDAVAGIHVLAVGDPEDRSNPNGAERDLVLTQASLYWFTGAVAATFRPYWEHRTYPPGPIHVTAPTGVAVFPGDLVQPPRSWAERNYHVVHYTRMPRGGHFAAREQPDLLAADIRAFARKL